MAFERRRPSPPHTATETNARNDKSTLGDPTQSDLLLLISFYFIIIFLEYKPSKKTTGTPKKYIYNKKIKK